MLAWKKQSTLDALAARVSALREEIAALQPAARRGHGLGEHGLEQLAGQASAWISERADVLDRLGLHRPGRRGGSGSALPVLVAALAVGAGVGCVLYALTSSRKVRPATDGAARPSASVAD